MPEQSAGFYVQRLDGDIEFLPIGTRFYKALEHGDTDWGVWADRGPDADDVLLFNGTNEACRDYLSHLLMNMLQVGIPAVPTQQIVQAQRPNPEDQKRWGGGSRR